MGLNFERLDRAIDWAIAEDAKKQSGDDSAWRQGLWIGKSACGTSCCIAGNIVIDAGYKPVFTHHYEVDQDTATVESPVTGNVVGVAEAALSVLDLDPEDDDEDLFEAIEFMFDDGDNDLEAIKRYRDYAARAAGVPVRFGYTENESIDDINVGLAARLTR